MYIYVCIYICGVYVSVLKKKERERILWLKVPIYDERGIQMHHKSTIFSGLCLNIQKISSVKVSSEASQILEELHDPAPSAPQKQWKLVGAEWKCYPVKQKSV